MVTPTYSCLSLQEAIGFVRRFVKEVIASTDSNLTRSLLMLLECLFQPFIPIEVGFCYLHHHIMPVTLRGIMSCRELVTREWSVGYYMRQWGVGAERSCCSSCTWQKVTQHPAKHRWTRKDYALPTERAKDKLYAYQAGGKTFTFTYSRGNWRRSGKQTSELSSDALQTADLWRISIEEGWMIFKLKPKD